MVIIDKPRPEPKRSKLYPQAMPSSSGVETADLVKELRGLGYSYKDIGEHLDTHWRTVYRWAKKETEPWAPKLINYVLRGLIAGHQVSYHNPAHCQTN